MSKNTLHHVCSQYRLHCTVMSGDHSQLGCGHGQTSALGAVWSWPLWGQIRGGDVVFGRGCRSLRYVCVFVPHRGCFAQGAVCSQ